MFPVEDLAKCKVAPAWCLGRWPKATGTADARCPGMFDLVFVLVTVAFFALGVLYTRACDHL